MAVSKANLRSKRVCCLPPTPHQLGDSPLPISRGFRTRKTPRLLDTFRLRVAGETRHQHLGAHGATAARSSQSDRAIDVARHTLRPGVATAPRDRTSPPPAQQIRAPHQQGVQHNHPLALRELLHNPIDPGHVPGVSQVPRLGAAGAAWIRMPQVRQCTPVLASCCCL